MICATVLDHDYGPETIVSAYRHPVNGRMLVVQQTCDHCGRVRRTTRRAIEPKGYAIRDAYWGEM